MADCSGAVDLGTDRELFADDRLIENLENARMRLHRPQPGEIAIQCERPWEGTGPGYATVFKDGNLHRMYYRIQPDIHSPDNDERQVTCYAESDDGIRWRKPELGLFRMDGSPDNNVIWEGVISHNFTPFRDDNPACPAGERFKAVGGIRVESGGEGLIPLVSSDGIHWRRWGQKPLSFPGYFDSQNVIFWDRTRNQYRAYWRDFRRGHPKIPDGRDVLTAVSPDCIHWGEPSWLDYGPNRSGSAERDQGDDPTGDHHQLYTNGVLPYFRAPQWFLGFPKRYADRGWTASVDVWPDREQREQLAARHVGGGRPTRMGTMASDMLFMASRDGATFFVWPEAFVRPGVQRPGNWCYGDTTCAWGLVDTPALYRGAPPELSFYVQEKERIDGPWRLRRYHLRTDGFASVGASLEGGVLTTKLFTFSGSLLEINFATSAGGRLAVEIQDGQGEAIPGFAMEQCHLQYGDQLDRIVSWQSGEDVGALAGKPVRLRILLKDADLYAIRFRGEDL